jgi:hypothetical protein
MKTVRSLVRDFLIIGGSRGVVPPHSHGWGSRGVVPPHSHGWGSRGVVR